MRHLVLTIDIDSPTEYAAIHGLRLDAEDPHFMYRKPLERFIELCNSLSAPATLFAITRDVCGIASEALGHLSEQGFEIASHSHLHDYQLSRRKSGYIAHDLRFSKATMRRELSVDPLGFRAPGYNLSPTLINELKAAGFTYDSSAMPCPTYFAAKAAVMTAYWIAARPTQAMLGPMASTRGPRQPYAVDRNPYQASHEDSQTLIELPIATATPLRLPVTGAALAMMPNWLLNRCINSLEALDQVVINFHTMDFVDAKTDNLGAALASKQPEIDVPLPQRMRRFKDVLGRLRAGRQTVTAAALAAAVREKPETLTGH